MAANYQETLGEILKKNEVEPSVGLRSDEVSRRALEFGRNELKKRKRESIFVKIASQFKDVSVIILLIAAILSLALAIKDGSGFIEPAVIFIIIGVNIFLAVSHEKSAEKALEALSALSSPRCKVIRDGHVQEIDTTFVVPGDILSLKAGDLVPADARIIKADGFSVDESSLTGESEPSKKNPDAVFSGDVPLGDRVNMMYSSCLVLTGNATAIVTETGMRTEIGKIAGFLSEKKRYQTPLQVRLDKVGRMICGLAIMSSIALLTVGLMQEHDFWHLALVAVTLAVAAVPETLSLIVTLTLTHGVKKMARKNALILKIQAVETLGSTSVICSDKTGTLTMNKMAVKRLWIQEKDAIDDAADFSGDYLGLLEKFVLASNAALGVDNAGSSKIIGDPTETAILRLAREKGVDIEAVRTRYKKVAEIPFSSARKMMTAIVEDPDGGYIVFTKGAFDRIPFGHTDKNYMRDLEDVHNSFAKDALRVLTLAAKKIDELPADGNLEEVETGLEFKGFVGIIDPPREEAGESIRRAKHAGIRTIMITGDHAATARAIARQLGIIFADEGVITGQQLSGMTEEELANSIEFYSVYARVSPEDKIRIVKAWQSRGEVVAMTGDGVNDAPALEAADVGVAMGINGTEVSKSAAAMILMDDKFSTIIEAVVEGRNVFSNIRKLIYFLLVCNISEIVAMLFAQFMNWPLPLTPMMLLLINVLGDGVPGMALSKEVSDERIMSRKPIEREESFFAGGLMEVIIQQTFVFALVTLGAFAIGYNYRIHPGYAPSVEIARTMAFLVTGWTSILHALTVRSRSSIVKYRIKDNPQLYLNCLIMFLAFGLLVAFPPFAGIFGFAALSGMHWLVVLGLTMLPTLVAEYGKFWDALKFKTMERNRVKPFQSYRDE
ncbi:MAG: Calcium-transporting ATPase 1 [Lentisphaerae bacterium ADurb.Bin242]|nr:MAG: Calcium-transporting ATPase 1 [Lentisphaerae bacterium ADurb.Bin242]